MTYLFLTLAFLLELVAFFSFAFSPLLFQIDKTEQVILAIVLFVALIIFWSLFMAPKAVKKFKLVPYYASKSIIYAIAAIVLFKTTTAVFGCTFIVLVVADEMLLFKHNTA